MPASENSRLMGFMHNKLVTARHNKLVTARNCKHGITYIQVLSVRGATIFFSKESIAISNSRYLWNVITTDISAQNNE